MKIEREVRAFVVNGSIIYAFIEKERVKKRATLSGQRKKLVAKLSHQQTSYN